MNERPHLTGTTLYPEQIEPVADSFAYDIKTNNTFHDWNFAVLIYCSQDFFIGDRSESVIDEEGNELWFQGALILKDWIEELTSYHMKNATNVLLIGSSAGGYGLMYNYKTIASIFSSHSLSAEISVLLDSCFVEVSTEYDVRKQGELYVTNWNKSICSYYYNGLSCCVQSDCMIPEVMPEVKVLAVTGLYDWMGWLYLPTPSHPPRIDYFDSYAVRLSARLTDTIAKSPKFSAYITQCHSHQYIKLIDITTVYCDYLKEHKNIIINSGDLGFGFSWTIDCTDRLKPTYMYCNEILKFWVKSENLHDIPFVPETSIRTAVSDWLNVSDDSSNERFSWIDKSCSGLSCNCDMDYEFIISIENTWIFDIFPYVFWVMFLVFAFWTWNIRRSLNSLKKNMQQKLLGSSSLKSLSPPKTSETMVSCKGLGLKFGEKLILVDVNLELRGGVFNALVGRTGSGKSSFAKIIVGEYEVSSGSVAFNNQPVHKNMLKHISSMLHQHQLNYIEQLTVLENLICSIYVRTKLPDEEIMKIISTVCENTELTFLLKKLTATLSGGERKLLGIAIELLTDPQILVLDEVTSGLDAAMALLIMKATQRTVMKEKLVCLVVIHQPRMEIWRLFEKILVCHNKCIFPKDRTVIERDVLRCYKGPMHINIADLLVDFLHKEYTETRPSYDPAQSPERLTMREKTWNLLINMKRRITSSEDDENKKQHHPSDPPLKSSVRSEISEPSVVNSNLSCLVPPIVSGSDSEESLLHSSGIAIPTRNDSLLKSSQSRLSERKSFILKPGIRGKERIIPRARCKRSRSLRIPKRRGSGLLPHEELLCVSVSNPVTALYNQDSKTKSLTALPDGDSKTIDTFNVDDVSRLSSKIEDYFLSEASSDIDFDQSTTKTLDFFEYKYAARMAVSNMSRESISGQNAREFVNKTFRRPDSQLRLSLLTPKVGDIDLMRKFKKEHTSKITKSAKQKKISQCCVLYRHFAISIWRSYLINSELKLFVQFIGFVFLCIFGACCMVVIFYDIVGKDVQATVTFVFFALGVMPFLCFSFVIANTCIHAKLFVSEHDKGFNSMLGFFLGQMARTFLDYGLPCLLFNALIYTTMVRLHGWDLHWIMRFWAVQILYTWLIIQVFYCIIILYGGRRDLAAGGINIFLALNMGLCGYLVPQPRMVIPVKYLSYLLPLYWYMQSSFVLMFKDQHIICELESDYSQNPLLCLDSIGNVILHAVHANSQAFAGTIIISTVTALLCFYLPYWFYNRESLPRKLFAMIKLIGKRYDFLEDTHIENIIKNPKVSRLTGMRAQNIRVNENVLQKVIELEKQAGESPKKLDLKEVN